MRSYQAIAVCFLLSLSILACKTPKELFRPRLDLAGQWQFALDTAGTGMQQRWYRSDLTDSIHLPGTTDLSRKGFLNMDTTTMHLNRVYRYEGAAWYRKQVVIPAAFAGKHIQLVLERSKPSQIWIDSTLVGSSKILQSPQQFDVTDHLSPGIHFITIRIDNSLNLTPYGNVHIYSDDTQTNWNGIIGNLFLEASAKTYIANLQVYPGIGQQKIDIKMEIDNQLNLDSLDVELHVEKTINGKTTPLKTQKIHTACRREIQLQYVLGEQCALWDEYQPAVYHLTAVITNKNVHDSKRVPFGMRKFSVRGTQFTLNGRTVFLRGKQDAAVFPRTGFPPMDVEGWVRVFKIAKTYGINHYRFHSYCPPEAAFTAADQEGIFLQPELPFWGGLEADSVANSLKEEGFGMLNAYANHPSFVLFSAGNEIWGGHEKVEANMLALKAYDNRPLYTMGSNNNIGYMAPKAYADYFIGARIPDRGDTTIGSTRLTHAFADAWQGGILNTQTPSTEVNFDYAVAHMPIPLISHETGQYQIYPDYREIEKYTGVLRARNLEVFRSRLEKAGMAHLDSAFHKASGAWSAICYKAEMEAALRTKGFAGFQLLDLQDFPGQGTALVGILDAFMDSKQVISPEAWRQSSNDVVLLLEFSKYCWTNNERFQATARIANYSNKTIHSDLKWAVRNREGSLVQQGTFPGLNIPNGGITTAGAISVDLSSIGNAEKLTIIVSIPGTAYQNAWPIWVYPDLKTVEIPDGIIVAEQLTSALLSQLQSGARVLLFPQTEDAQGKSVPGLFPPDFWNYGMFKGISERGKKPVSPGTLGLLTNPKHPIFKSFPTDFHTNWQWFSIIKASNALILDNTPKAYLPIVQVIDNLERNHKLGLIFEFKLGKGKLLVFMAQLNRILDKPEAIQLYQSMVDYMDSDDFHPDYELGVEEVVRLFSK
ncbi:MAG: beta-galactosidase [Lewinellaceae bacterium]|nr:beta-galactosidase [Lewinellaceae bacterium]